MLNKALQFTSDVLDQFLKNRFGLDENKVLLNRLINSDGSILPENQNKVIISLINIEKETNQPINSNQQKKDKGNLSNNSFTEKYNLDILISSNFNDYNETLKFLTEAITFFHVNTCIDATRFANFPKGLNKIEYDFEKVTFQNMQSLWTAMGAKYQPSVIYKMTLTTINTNEVEGFTSAIPTTLNTLTQ